jgi:Baseplate J-like protein
MNPRYYCQNENRRRLVEESTTLNGINYLEVQDDQTKLDVYFFHSLSTDPTDKLTADNILIEGGVRLSGIKVKPSLIYTDKVLTVTVEAVGDFSTYTLRLVKSPIDLSEPDGFDPQLAEIEFSFKVDCPSDFDCAPESICSPNLLPEPEIDYLAKDFNSFTRLMMDRLSMLTPAWRERNTADIQVALVELLAYVGDHLSYYQDAVATEAYLGTARKRISIRRHARLLDYFMHNGCNARTWVVFTVDENNEANGPKLATGANPILSGESSQSEDPVAFETLIDVTLHAEHNEINFHTWSDTDCCLSRGSTRATLKNNPSLYLDKNDFLLFEEVLSPTTGLAADADPAHRQVVRLINVDYRNDPLDGTSIVNIEWSADDALSFPLCLSTTITDSKGQQVPLPAVSVARGNVTLADHGLTFTQPMELIPPVAPERGVYRPRLDAEPLTYQGPFHDTVNLKTLLKPSAAALMRWDVHAARPIVEMSGAGETWKPSPRADLLSSDEFASEFIVELESNGVSYFRFGDDIHGRRPLPDSTFTTTRYRLGNGTAGNIGAEVLKRIVTDNPNYKIQVRNPLPARGGVDPEPLEAVRLYAPQAFRRQERAVTTADYAEVTQRHPEVQKAAATLRWTGSWYTMFITIDRAGGRRVDTKFKQEIHDFVERYRLAGYDVEINGPIFVPLDIQMKVCVKSGYFRSNVKRSLLEAFSNRDLPNGQHGFFHPDNFTFGQPVYLSRLYERALSIGGVQAVEITRFQRWGKAANQELENGVLTLDQLEVVQLDNDPNFAENGRLGFEMSGGI